MGFVLGKKTILLMSSSCNLIFQDASWEEMHGTMRAQHRQSLQIALDYSLQDGVWGFELGFPKSRITYKRPPCA